MHDKKVRGLPVLNKEGHLVGQEADLRRQRECEWDRGRQEAASDQRRPEAKFRNLVRLDQLSRFRVPEKKFRRIVLPLSAPGLFIAMIHDSISTTAADAEYVRGVLLDDFSRLGGVRRQVKVDIYDTN